MEKTYSIPILFLVSPLTFLDSARTGFRGKLVADDTPITHILPTQLNRPTVGDKWVPRPHLISRLNEGLKKRLTLISASAGYGKTTLVAHT